MLTDFDVSIQTNETAAVARAVEQRMINAVSEEIASAVNGGVVSTTGITQKLYAVMNGGISAIGTATWHDINGTLSMNAMDELQRMSRSGSVGNQLMNTVMADVVTRSNKVQLIAQQQTAQVMREATAKTNQEYLRALFAAQGEARVVGTKKAIENAVAELAEKGITTNNGRHVDAAIRNAVSTNLRSEQTAQILNIARETGQNLIEVSITGNARPSHAEWQGKIYSLKKGDDYPFFDEACHVGDPVDGIGGYNCGHRIAIYHKAMGKVFKDPLKGTGYTTEDVRKLTAKQRQIESNIRKQKRVVEALTAAGADHSTQDAIIRRLQANLRHHISENSSVLFRDRSRETIYSAARRKAGTLGSAAKQHRVVNGGDILQDWKRRTGEFQFAIEDILNAQGFDGVPRIVGKEDFARAVKKSGFVSQRTYAAADMETLDAYRDMLYRGKWYVDCSTGGAQYGQGMYCAGDLAAEVKSGEVVIKLGIREEMEHYAYIGKTRFGSNAVNYVETMTWDESTRFIYYEDLVKMREKYPSPDAIIEGAQIEDVLSQSVAKLGITDSSVLESMRAYIEYEFNPGGANFSEIIRHVSVMGEENRLAVSSVISSVKENYFQYVLRAENGEFGINALTDPGVYAAAMGYDAIVAADHGASGAYVVILNRTKLIIQGD